MQSNETQGVSCENCVPKRLPAAGRELGNEYLLIRAIRGRKKPKQSI